MKEPAKFAGQKACWVGQFEGGHQVGDGSGRFETRSTWWLAVDDKGNAVRELVFAVDEKSVKKTAAALAKTDGDRGQRLVCGVISGTEEVALYLDGKTKKVVAPLLTGATIDVRPPKGSLGALEP
jgi:hypothetical protein